MPGVHLHAWSLNGSTGALKFGFLWSQWSFACIWIPETVQVFVLPDLYCDNTMFPLQTLQKQWRFEAILEYDPLICHV